MHIRGITQDVTFGDRLFPLSIIPWRLVQVSSSLLLLSGVPSRDVPESG